MRSCSEASIQSFLFALFLRFRRCATFLMAEVHAAISPVDFEASFPAADAATAGVLGDLDPPRIGPPGPNPPADMDPPVHIR